MLIPKKRKREEHLKEKVCAFPGCDTKFFGTGASRYCKEHRGHRVEKENEIEDSNQFINHDYCEVQIVEMKCALDGCGNKFQIRILPRVYVYPKYCLEHRNSYKRERFMECISSKRSNLAVRTTIHDKRHGQFSDAETVEKKPT